MNLDTVPKLAVLTDLRSRARVYEPHGSNPVSRAAYRELSERIDFLESVPGQTLGDVERSLLAQAAQSCKRRNRLGLASAALFAGLTASLIATGGPAAGGWLQGFNVAGLMGGAVTGLLAWGHEESRRGYRKQAASLQELAADLSTPAGGAVCVAPGPGCSATPGPGPGPSAAAGPGPGTSAAAGPGPGTTVAPGTGPGLSAAAGPGPGTTVAPGTGPALSAGPGTSAAPGTGSGVSSAPGTGPGTSASAGRSTGNLVVFGGEGGADSMERLLGVLEASQASLRTMGDRLEYRAALAQLEADRKDLARFPAATQGELRDRARAVESAQEAKAGRLARVALPGLALGVGTIFCSGFYAPLAPIGVGVLLVSMAAVVVSTVHRVRAHDARESLSALSRWEPQMEALHRMTEGAREAVNRLQAGQSATIRTEAGSVVVGGVRVPIRVRRRPELT